MLILNSEIVKLLADAKIVSSPNLLSYIRKSKDSADQFGVMLIRDNHIDRSEMGKIISDTYNISYTRLDHTFLCNELIRKSDHEICYKYNFVPIYQFGNTISIASSNPFNEKLVPHLKELYGLPVSVVYSFSDEIEHYISVKINDKTSEINPLSDFNDQHKLGSDQLQTILAEYLSIRQIIPNSHL